jgi:hypothetical protein
MTCRICENLPEGQRHLSAGCALCATAPTDQDPSKNAMAAVIEVAAPWWEKAGKWCCACGRHGHLAHDCNQGRGRR